MKVLIFSASIGEGHDLPARVLADGIAEEAPAVEVEIVDSLALVNPFVRRLVLDSSRFHSDLGKPDLRPLLQADHRRATDTLVRGEADPVARRQADRRAVLERAPDVVVSTYPGSTEVLGDLRAKGRIDVPVVSAITDLAALRFWAHPGVDLHLITHPESAEEVHQIAPGTGVVCVRGLTDERFYVRARSGGGAARPRSAGGGAGRDRLGRRLGCRRSRGGRRGGPRGPRRNRGLPLRAQGRPA